MILLIHWKLLLWPLACVNLAYWRLILNFWHRNVLYDRILRSAGTKIDALSTSTRGCQYA